MSAVATRAARDLEDQNGTKETPPVGTGYRGSKRHLDHGAGLHAGRHSRSRGWRGCRPTHANGPPPHQVGAVREGCRVAEVGRQAQAGVGGCLLPSRNRLQQHEPVRRGDQGRSAGHAAQARLGRATASWAGAGRRPRISGVRSACAPFYAEAHSDLGAVYLLLGDRAAALEEYRTVQSIDPGMAGDLFRAIYQSQILAASRK